MFDQPGRERTFEYAVRDHQMPGYHRTWYRDADDSKLNSNESHYTETEAEEREHCLRHVKE